MLTVTTTGIFKMDHKLWAVLVCFYLPTVALAGELMGPRFLREPADVLFDEGSSITSISLFCEATGQQPLTYSWIKDGQTLDTAADERYVVTSDRLTINGPERAKDDGSYYCTVENEEGKVLSREAMLKFAYVDLYPILYAYDDVSLEINRWGCINCHPPEHYPGVDIIWYKGVPPVEVGGRIRVTTDGRLCFANVEATDAGTYHCMVRADVENEGTASYFRSPFVTLKTTPGSSSEVSPPRVAIEVPDITVKAGQDAVFECFFSGNPPPTIEWQRQTPADQAMPGSASIAHAGQELVIRDAKPEDAGEYECRGSNDQERDVRSSGTLTVVSAPTWVEEPTDEELDIMSDLLWICNAESPYEVTYTWYRNAEEIEASDNRIVFRDNFRAATFTDLQEDDSAMYQCKASNEYGHVISTAQLKVNAIPPSFPIPVQMNQPAARGGSVLILCKPEGAPKPTIKWYRGPQVVTSVGRFNVTEEGHLYITEVEDGDAGNYRCEAENTFSAVSSTGSLVIKDGTVIESPPMPKTIVIEDDGTLECGAKGDPDFELIYIWRFEGQQINIDENPHYRQEEGNLHLLDVTQEMQGEYTCRAETTIDADMRSAEITVSGPPDPPTAVDVELDEFLATLTWIKGAEHNSATIGFVIEVQTNHEPEWTEVKRVNDLATVTISGLSPWSTYHFRVRATSDLGVGSPSSPSQPVDTPAAEPTASPSGVSGGGGNQGDLKITWEPLDGKDQNGPGLYYIVHWKQKDSNNQFESAEVRTGQNVHIVSNVPVYTLYEVKVQAGNDVGDGPISEVSEVYSYQEAPKDAPAMVEAEPSSGTELYIQWDAVDDSNFQGVLTGYRIYYWPEGSSQEDAAIVETEGEGTMALIEELDPATKYFIVIEAKSGGGEGPASQEVTATTKKMAPLNAPVIREARLKNGDSVTIRWSSIKTGSTEEPLGGYKILIWKHGALIDTATTVTVGKDITSYTIKSLDPKTTYYIKVQGTSEGGDGVLSAQKMVETDKPSAGAVDDPDNGGGMTTSFTSLIASLVLMSLLMYLE